MILKLIRSFGLAVRLALFLFILSACQAATCLPDTNRQLCAAERLNMNLVNHWGGPTLSVAVQGNYAYVGRGFELEVLDISDKTKPQRVGYVLAAANDIVIDGNFAFVGGRAGITIVDITKPTQPNVIAIHPTASVPIGLAIQGGYLYVGEDYGGLRVLDVRQPTRSQEVAFRQLPIRITDLALQDNLAYLTTSQGLRLIDISVPTQLSSLESNDISQWLNTVAVQGQYIFLGTFEAFITMERIDNGTMQLVDSVAVAGGVADIEVVGAFVFVANGTKGVSVFDLTSTGNPTLLNHLQLSGDVGDIAYAGGYVFAPNSRDYLHILQFSLQNHLYAIAEYAVPGISHAIAIAGQRAIVLSTLTIDMESNMHVFDIAKARNIDSISEQPVSIGTKQLAIQAEYAYLVSNRGAIDILEFANLTTPTPLAVVQGVSFLPTTQSADSQQRARLLVLDNQNTLSVFDVTNRLSPVKIGLLQNPNSTFHDVIAWKGYALIAAGKTGLLIADLSYPENPRIISQVATEGFANALVATEQFAIVASGKTGLQVIDLADPQKPRLASQLTLAGEALDVALWGSIVIVAAGEAGVYLIDVTDPENPLQVEFFNTADSALALATDGNLIYVADRFGGIYVLAID